MAVPLLAPGPRWRLGSSRRIQGRLLLTATLAVQGILAFIPPPPPQAAPSGPEAYLAENALSWAAANGLQISAPTSISTNPGVFIHLPISLLPASLPQDVFEEVVEVAPIFNTLVDRISRDDAWLQTVLAQVVKSDPFTAKLMELYRTVLKESPKPAQPMSLGIQRSDYMLDQDRNRLLQVELNTIASSFGCVSTLTAQLHRYLLQRFGRRAMQGSPSDRSFFEEYLKDQGLKLGLEEVLSVLHEEDKGSQEAWRSVTSLEQLPAILFNAYWHYNRPGSVVVMVVQPGERNIVDQRLLEFALWERFRVETVRLSLAEINARCKLQGPSQALMIDGKTEVAVVYFRAGYTPTDYPSASEDEWKARLLVERSSAVKCPTLGYQLAGTKKVQQALCKAGELERFVTAGEAGKLRRHFVGLYPLGADEEVDAEARRAIEAAIKDPKRYVLKPQREGGGNNLYDDQVREALESWSPDRLAGHVLMERIFPPQRRALLLTQGQVTSGPTLSELGVFGTFLGNEAEGRVIDNGYAGYLVRTKLSHVNEGGVATGYAVVNSLLIR